MIKGVLYNISAWSRTSQNGREYISLQAEEKTEEDHPSRPQQGGFSQRPSYQAPSPAPYQAPVEDDLPAGPEELEDLPF